MKRLTLTFAFVIGILSSCAQEDPKPELLIPNVPTITLQHATFNQPNDGLFVDLIEDNPDEIIKITISDRYLIISAHGWHEQHAYSRNIYQFTLGRNYKTGKITKLIMGYTDYLVGFKEVDENNNYYIGIVGLEKLTGKMEYYEFEFFWDPDSL